MLYYNQQKEYEMDEEHNWDWVNNFKLNSNSLVSFIPAIKIDGNPFSLDDHFVMAPLLKNNRAKRQVWQCSRQVGKSAFLSARGCLNAGLIDHWNILTVQPRYDQVSKYSKHRVRPMIKDSALLSTLRGRGTDAEMEKTFDSSGSILYYSYAFLDCERIRGISYISEIFLDEVDDIQYDFIPVIEETASAVKGNRGFFTYTGTPKMTDGTLSVLFQDSSAAEWCTPCSNCKKLNVSCTSQDLLKMIGKETVICAKCGKAIDPSIGWYEHAKPHLRNTFEGYHIPQVVHGLHYKDVNKWFDLRRKMDTYPKAKFYNEILGEPCDESLKLLTKADLFRASTKLENSLANVLKTRGRYHNLFVGVDWSGKGEGESTTAIAIVGEKVGSDVLDCLYMERFPITMRESEECMAVLEYFKVAKALWIAHDYGGAGMLRETLLLQAGAVEEHIAPFTYVYAPARHVITFNQDTASQRKSWSLDKARSLAILCAMIAGGKVTLPDLENDENYNVASDLLALVEETREMPRGGVIRLITKQPKKRDDFAHALNLACSCAWHSRGSYPSVEEAERFRISEETMKEIKGVRL